MSSPMKKVASALFPMVYCYVIHGGKIMKKTIIAAFFIIIISPAYGGVNITPPKIWDGGAWVGIDTYAGAAWTTFEQDIDSALNIFTDLPNLATGMANSAAMTSSEVATMTSYGHYKTFSVAAGINVAVQAPASNITDIMEAFGTIADEGDVYAGFAPGAALSGGIHLGVFNRKLKGMYVDFKFMYLPTITMDFDSATVEAEYVSWGVGFAWNFIKRADLVGGVLGWGGLTLHSGYYGTYSNYNIKMNLSEISFSADVDSGIGGDGTDETIVFTPQIGVGFKTHTHSIPIDLMTSFRLLWVMDIRLGVGLTLNLGESTVNISQYSTMALQDTPIATQQGSATVTIDEKQPPVFATAKVMTGLGFKIFMVVIDIPMTLQIPLEDPEKLAASVGVTVGVVF